MDVVCAPPVDDVSWEDLREKHFMFHVWRDGKELEWAKDAWIRLSAAGLTSFETENERTQVCVRLMVLAEAYETFAEITFEESANKDVLDWAEGLHLQPFHVGRWIGEIGTEITEIEANEQEDEVLCEAYDGLIKEQRPIVHRALATSHGGCEKLYLSMYRVNESCDKEETQAWDVTFANSNGLEYITNGFRRG